MSQDNPPSPLDAIFSGGSQQPQQQQPPSSGGPPPAEDSIEELLQQAQFEDPSAVAAYDEPRAQDKDGPGDLSEFDFPNFQQVMRDAQVSSIELLRDVDLNVKIELGRARMLVEEVLVPRCIPFRADL